LGSLFDDTDPVFQPAGVRTAGLRCGGEVFEGEEPLQIIAHADQGPPSETFACPRKLKRRKPFTSTTPASSRAALLASRVLAAAPALVDPKVGDGQLIHGIEDEVHYMTGGHSFPKIIRQKHRCLAV
jgi:hypothetical protein